MVLCLNISSKQDLSVVHHANRYIKEEESRHHERGSEAIYNLLNTYIKSQPAILTTQ